MIRNKDILNSLPLLASVLGDQYGVKVVIGGEEARTDGRTIHLPSLPMDCDAELLAMARGFLDHEAGHIRHTDFEAIKQAQMDSVTFNLFNAIEDWRIEKKLGELYPGCRQNLHWLIKRLFIENHGKNPERAEEKSSALLVLKYVLLTVRLWEVKELSERVEQIRLEMDSRFPELRQQIDLILNKVKQNCTDSINAISYAQQISALIKNWQPPANQRKESTGKRNEKQPPTESGGENTKSETKIENTQNQDSQISVDTSSQSGNEKTEYSSHAQKEEKQTDNSESEKCSESDAQSDLASLFSMQANELPQGLGELLGSTLTSLADDKSDSVMRVAILADGHPGLLDDEDIAESLSASVALRTRLSGFLQSRVQKHICHGRQGRLDTGSLYRLSVANPKIFRKESEREGLNTG